MKEVIRNSTITEKIGNDEYTVIITKWDGCYYWILRMWTKVEGSYKDVKNHFADLFAKLWVDIKVKKTRSDKGKAHNYPAVQFKEQRVHKGRPKGKPRGPRKPALKKKEEISSDGFMNKVFKRK
jgi:hypothetical protein